MATSQTALGSAKIGQGATALKRFIPYFFHQHPQADLQTAWNLTQLSWLVAPIHGVAFVILGLLAFGHTWAKRGPMIRQHWLNQGFAILTIWLVFTTCIAKDPTAALLGLPNFLPFFLVFVSHSSVIQTPNQLQHLAWWLVNISLPITLMGMGQLFWGWQGPPPPWEGIWGWALVPQGNPTGRMASVFMYANSLAAYLVMVLPLGMALWLHGAQDWLKVIGQKTDAASRGWLQSATLKLLVLTLILAGMIGGIIWTNSRNAWGLLALSCLAFAVYLGWHWILAIVGLMISLIAGAAFGPSPAKETLRSIVPAFFWARLSDELYPNRPIAELRQTQWQFAWFMAEQRPFTGWGLRNFTPLYEAQTGFFLGHPHNLFLMLMAEIGFPGAVLFCLLVGWILYRSIRLLQQWEQWLPWATGSDRRLFFSYILAFSNCILFNCLDVTVMDYRVNTVGWLLLSAIWGVTNYQQAHEQAL